MKGLSLLILFTCFNASSTGFAQSSLPKQDADSLWAVWSDESQPDTLRADAIYNYIWNGYLYSQPDSALYFAQILYDFAKAKELKKQIAGSFRIKGVIFQRKAEYEQALVNYQQSLKVAEEIGDKRIKAFPLNNIGNIYADQGDYTQALAYYQQSLKISEEIVDKQGKAIILRKIGNIYLYQGDNTQALAYYQQSLKISEEIGDKEGKAFCINNIGYIYKNQGDYTQALAYYQQSLKISEEIGARKVIAASLGNIGGIYAHQGNYTQSLAYFKESLKISEEIGAIKDIALTINNIGGIYGKQGDYSKALAYYQQSLEIKEEIGDKRGIAISLNSIGNRHNDLGDYKKALTYHQRSLRIMEEIGDKQGIAASLCSIGINYNKQGNDTQALAYYQESLKILEETGDKQGKAASLNNIGVIYKTQGDYTQALVYYQKGLEIFEEIGYKEGKAASFCAIGINYKKQGDYASSINYTQKGYTLSNTIGAKSSLRLAARNLFQSYILTDSLTKAEQYLNELIELRRKDLQVNYPSLSEAEKENYFVTMGNDFVLQYDFAIQHPEFKSQTTTTLNNALLLKGMSLKSSLALRQNILSSGDSLLMADYESWRELKRKASKAYAEGEDFTEFEQQANELEKELAKSSDAFASMQKAQSITGQDVIQKLNKGEAAIEFVRFNHTPDYQADSIKFQQYLAFVMLPEKEPKMVRLFKEEELAKLLETTGGNPATQIEQVYGSKNKSNDALYQLIWKPLEAHLEGVNRVYFAAGGLLHKVSLAAMRSESGNYLSEQYDLHQLNSTAQLIEFSPLEFSSDDPVLLAGGVNYGDGGSKGKIWKYLPGTLTEAQGIEQTLKKKKVNVQLVTENKATEETIKQEANKAGILHIATHGFFYPDPEQVKEEMKSKTIAEGEELAFRGSTDYAYWSFVLNKNPLMRSGLVLANANDVWDREALAEGEDGILTALEISNLDLRKAKLVVLSACETGLGDIKGSEGVYGLQRAFKMAGAKSLIMSLWQVPDKETSEFMSHFYKKLLKEKDTRKAFNQTQKAMRKKYDPYYWAAFVLVE